MPLFFRQQCCSELIFHYNRHEDEKLITETIPVIDFIERLLQHVLEHHLFYLSYNQWRNSILVSFGYDPLKCKKCGTTMISLELYFDPKPVPLHEITFYSSPRL